MTVAPSFDPTTSAAYQFHGQDVGWLLDHWAANRGNHPFLVWEPRDGATKTWTYAEFAESTKQVAAGLAARGIAEGDAVLIHADNCPEGVIGWYATARLGAIAVTTNTRSVAAELEYFITHSGAKGAITQPQYASLVQEAGSGLKFVVVTEDNSGGAPTPEQAGHGLDPFSTLV